MRCPRRGERLLGQCGDDDGLRCRGQHRRGRARGDAAGIVTNFAYDALDRLTAKTYPASPGEAVAYRYDEASAVNGIGRLTSVSDASGSTAYVYDVRGNVTQETRV